MPPPSWPPDPTAVPWWKDPWALGIALAAALLLLPNLESSGLLWQDEAETAVLAKNTLAFGYPKAFDGVNRVNPGLPTGPGDSWTYHPWLQFYVTAAAFQLFGATTASARLPFALLGIACLVVAYRLALQTFRHPGIARLAGLMTLLSVPLLLHVRQCRYYALGILGLLWVLWAYRQIRDGRRHGWGWFAAGLMILFHSHHGAWFPTVAALGVDFWRRGLPATERRPALLTAGVVAALTLPWCLLANPFDPSRHHAAFSLAEAGRHAQFYARQINRFILPLQFLLVVWLFRGLHPRRWWRAADARQREGAGTLMVMITVHLLFLVFVPEQRHFRYLIQLAPLLLLGQAALLWGWLGRRQPLLALVSALLIATDLLHYSAPYAIAQAVPAGRAIIARDHGLVVPQSLLADYGYELTHRYQGPLDGLIGTLRREGRPGDLVKTPYDDHAVIFYTGLTVEDPNRFAEPTRPTWIIPRREWVPGGFFASTNFQAVQREYVRIETAAPDLAWENRPDPGYHKFRTVRDAPKIVLYRRPRAGETRP
ncbi:MAG: hypothetical protein A3C53_01865 [Omnitrophica WOR_2 bacterium RIFCSPHIGHO2_02_FULL_68_15]|nr:MAG: hypothetical protein A3C53_01865 [Omnitrophica WOR_2 bacterium RIFCSPHIGHO2_02_FULL_68_15]